MFAPNALSTPMNLNTSIFVKATANERPTTTADIRAQLAQRHGVPPQYATAFGLASVHTGYPVSMLAAHARAENGGKWDPTLRGRRDPSDLGITQMNPLAWDAITGRKGGRNYFKDNWGHDPDPTNGNDQALGTATYLNRLKQFDLPARGIANPTAQQVFTAYNTGAGNVNTPRGRSYQDLLARSGMEFKR